ncbi:uncharacterized protein [Rutidosis leptorrhynchoides]|uniref:uncharacterized protein n=1 Tax=Rutidosis leptorrhynchoides TaxID=125765 RepID=UPI003A996F86
MLIDEQLMVSVSVSEATMHNRLVPKKFEIFAWRATKKLLPVRTELDKKGIDLHSVRCPLCDDGLESVDHTLIFCKYAVETWDRIFKWWGFGNFSNLSVNEILKGNAPVSMSSLGKKVWQAVEWVCGYFIWRNRNNKVFRDTSWDAQVALNEIQIKSFDWISRRINRKKIDWLT